MLLNGIYVQCSVNTEYFLVELFIVPLHEIHVMDQSFIVLAHDVQKVYVLEIHVILVLTHELGIQSHFVFEVVSVGAFSEQITELISQGDLSLRLLGILFLFLLQQLRNSKIFFLTLNLLEYLLVPGSQFVDLLHHVVFAEVVSVDAHDLAHVFLSQYVE